MGREDPLEKKMATHSGILAWKIPWTKEPSKLQSEGSQKSQIWLSDWTTAAALCKLQVYNTVIHNSKEDQVEPLLSWTSSAWDVAPWPWFLANKPLTSEDRSWLSPHLLPTPLISAALPFSLSCRPSSYAVIQASAFAGTSVSFACPPRIVTSPLRCQILGESPATPWFRRAPHLSRLFLSLWSLYSFPVRSVCMCVCVCEHMLFCSPLYLSS